MKTIEVTIVRRVYTTYKYKVADDFDVNAPGAHEAVENDYIDGIFGDEDQTYEEIDTWDIDYVGDIK
jgi:hypothetical protein